MSHALVTGGAGFVGSHLIDSLLTDGWRVTALDNFDPFYARAIKESNIRSHRQHANYRLLEVNLCDQAALDSLTDRYDAIVHLAARAGIRPSIMDPTSCQAINVTGTQQMLELARRLNVPQFVFASSSSVYGINPHVPWCEDDYVVRPISPYASSKVSGELLGHVYSHLYGMRFIALRFFTVYGPRQRPDLAIHSFARKILAGEPVTVFGDGTTSRDYTYVDDIISGVRAAMEYTSTPYEIINLGNNQTVSLLEMIDTLQQALGVRAITNHLPEQPGDVRQTWANINKAEALLGYRPRTRFDRGISLFIEWIRTSDAQLLSSSVG